MLSNTISKHNLYDSNNFNSLSNVSCETEEKWAFGQIFKNHLKNNYFTGLSGHVEFNNYTGLRSKFRLLIGDKIKNSIVGVNKSSYFFIPDFIHYRFFI